MTDNNIKRKFTELKKDLNFRTLTVIILSFLFLAIAFLPLFKPYHRGTADGLAHKFRLVSFINSLNDGILRPRWLADQAMGFGAPIFMFNYSFPYYAISGIKYSGFDIRTSVQIFQAATLVFSFIFMYLFIKKLWGSPAGMVAAAVYTYSPYHLLTIYTYEGWGEFTAFVFPPLILFLLLRFKKNTVSNFLLLTFSWLFFILSHNVSVLIYSPVLLIIGTILLWGKKQTLFYFFCSFFGGIILSAFFWLPAILMNKLTKYPDLIVQEAGMRGTFFKPAIMQIKTALESIRTVSTYYPDFTAGLPVLLTVIIFPIFYFLTGNREKKLFYLYFLLILCLFLTTPSSRGVWDEMKIMNYIVYPFRLLAPAAFLGAVLAGFTVIKYKPLGIILLALAVISGYPFTQPRVEIFPFNDGYFSQIQTFTSPPGTLKNMATREFLPKTASIPILLDVEKKYTETKVLPEKFDFKQGAQRISEELRAEKMSITYNSTVPDILTVNSFYFPNWQAYIDGQKTKIEADIDGRITIKVPKGRHRAEFIFGYTAVEKTANLVSLAGLAGLSGAVLWMTGKLKSGRI